MFVRKELPCTTHTFNIKLKLNTGTNVQSTFQEMHNVITEETSKCTNHVKSTIANMELSSEFVRSVLVFEREAQEFQSTHSFTQKSSLQCKIDCDVISNTNARTQVPSAIQNLTSKHEEKYVLYLFKRRVREHVLIQSLKYYRNTSLALRSRTTGTRPV